MSTGANCVIFEKTPDQWFYKIQLWPYGESTKYDTGGPFKTAKLAIAHMDQNHGNPGGWTTHTHPGHVCEFKLEAESGWSREPIEVCQKCDQPKD